MKLWLERLAQAAFLIVGLYGGWKLSDWAVEGRDAKRAAREHRITERGCVQTGLYGVSGQRKVYSCHGWIVKEEDI